MPMGNDGGIGRDAWSGCAVAYGHCGIGLKAYLVPEVLVNKRLERLGTAFHDERLDVVGMQHFKVQRVAVVYNEPAGILSVPVAHGELRMVALLGDASHEDSILLCPRWKSVRA